MYDYVIASTDKGCGTHYNWYRIGDLPKDNEIHQISYCLNIGEGKCGLVHDGSVKKCSDMKYVFKLLQLPGCSQAYCIERLNGTNATDDSPPDISQVAPSISYKVEVVDKFNELHFFCNFTPPVGTDYFYVVEWGITTGYSWTDSLLRTQPSRFESHNEFMRNSSLTEPILRHKGFARLGITIACSIEAMNTPTGAISNTRVSDPKFCGIEVLNRRVYLNATEDATVSFQLTVPFGCQEWENKGCALDVTMFIPQNKEECKVPAVSQMEQVDRIDNRCGFRILNDEIMVPKTMRITSLLGQNINVHNWQYSLILATQKNLASHTLFQNYVPDIIQVDVSPDMTKIDRKWCHSQNDPHMTTFDGRRYENQNSGTFLLYRNKDNNVQVQMKTTQCYSNNNRIWCNCGVAVNAGRDVFILNSCPGSTPNLHPSFRCQDRIMARSVKGDTHGQKFVVYLPTGTEVHITLGWKLLNIKIKPSLSDWEKTDGLCGLFNGKPDDDIVKRPGSTESDSNLSWSVDGTNETLFNPDNDVGLIPWSRQAMLCHCPHSITGNPDNNIECRPDKSKKCIDDDKTYFEERCSVSRRKRNVHGIYILSDDLHRTTNTNFVSKVTTAGGEMVLRAKRETYDSASAREDCLEVLNTTAFQMCSKVIDVENFLHECILDAVATNSMEWSLTHLDALKDQCVYEVKINQPLTEEDLEGTNSSIPDISPNNTVDSEPNSPAFTKEFLEELKDYACLDDCNGNGRCEKGECVCTSDFVGAACSIKSSDPPVMTGIPDDGECDLQYRECAKTSVFGKNFVSSSTLTCRLVPFKVGSDLSISTEESFMRPARLQTFVEVSCSLLNKKAKRSSESTIEDYIARGYKVSVSNNGVIFSEEDVLVIFDSECLNCTKHNGEIVCTQKAGYCVRKGQCYNFGEKNGCYYCGGDVKKALKWLPGSDCPIPDPVPSGNEDQKLWIIPAVLCPVLFIVVFISIFCHLKVTRALANRKLTSMTELQSGRFERMQKKV